MTPPADRCNIKHQRRDQKYTIKRQTMVNLYFYRIRSLL